MGVTAVPPFLTSIGNKRVFITHTNKHIEVIESYRQTQTDNKKHSEINTTLKIGEMHNMAGCGF